MALTDNLLAYYRFDETSGTNVEDVHSDHDGTASRTNILNNAGGILGYKGVFSAGVADRVEIPNHADLRPTGNFSVQGWLKMSSSTTYHDLANSCSQYTGTGPSGFRLGVNMDDAHDHKAGFMIGNGATGSPPFVWSTTSVDDDAWHYLVGTWDGTYMKLYIDGTQEGGDVSGINAAYQTSNFPTIGVFHYNTSSYVCYMNGSVDEVAYWGRAITSTEVTTLWNDGTGYNILTPENPTINVSDSPTVTENVTAEAPAVNYNISTFDSAVVTEDKTVTIVAPNILFVRVGQREGVEIH